MVDRIVRNEITSVYVKPIFIIINCGQKPYFIPLFFAHEKRLVALLKDIKTKNDPSRQL